ncbi:MAG: hypothetical protein JWM87_4067 [Candidatus Eremiobacteraeota bacterium]|nr:hypothetical protein [Candidatus Eremiobacteraeota bacterium]
MTAVVPYHPGGIGGSRRSARYGAADVVQFAAGGVAADVRVERVDRHDACSWYALRLASAECDVTARLVGVRARGGTDELGCVAVAAGSGGSARFAVTTPRRGAYRAMFLEIRSDELLLHVEAPRPPAPRSLRAFKAGAALFVAGIAVSAAGVLALAPGIPRAVPAGVAHAPGAATSISHGAPLLASHGALQPVAAVARVLSFSARRDAGAAGETVLASYLAVADRGTIALLDQAETVVASARFSRVGTVRLPVPRAYRTAPMIARITVHRGTTTAVASVGVPADPLASTVPAVVARALGIPGAPQASAVANAEQQPAESGARAAGATSGENAGALSVDGPAVAGRPLKLRLPAHSTATHVELQDLTGATLADTDIARGVTHAVLPLPAATAPVTYLLALHFTRNGGEETVIRTIVALPR